MTKGNLTIGSLSQDISISPNEIKGKNDGVRSYLAMFLHMTIRVSKSDKTSSVNFRGVHARLSLQGSAILLSTAFSAIDTSVSYRDENGERTTGAWLEFQLDDKAIHSIQKSRNGGDTRFQIDFLFDVIFLQDLALIKGHPCWTFDGSKHLRGDIHLSIPKSIWVEKIFPDLGFPTFKLVEIPLKHELMEEAYENIIEEFALAAKYFNQEDYTKCVSHCRHTIDDLTRNLGKVKKKVESETLFRWLTTIDDATFTWIDTIDKSLSSVTSKAHHPGLKRDFTRREAESIYLVTLALLNFIGQYADNEQTKKA